MDTTFVYGIDKKKFFEILNDAEIQNDRFGISYVTRYKLLDNPTYQYCMLFDKEKKCLALVIVDITFNGPGDKKFTYILELRRLAKGGGFGKKALLMAMKKFGPVLLMANPSQSKSLVKYYQDPEFGFDEHVIDAANSIYDAETHFFSRGVQATSEEWQKWLSYYYYKKSKGMNNGRE